MKAKKRSKGKKVANQFVLSVGDEGAIFAHYSEGKLANKLFIDSPFSPDIKLIERLTSAYPESPISILVDVIEQNYTQQVLPPVSSFGVRQQVNRRIKRDFQPNDLNNVISLGRSKEGRKDWNFLFISLANTDPFAKWLDLVLSQKNDFRGVYLLPVEAVKLVSDINKSSLSATKHEWELLVLHNKTGGFRIVALKDGKIIFTRLAQNLVGDNIAEIIVGNMEQEIFNTVEYLKRLAFKGEAESKITVVASAEILQKVTPKSLKFGTVELLTPFQLSQKLDLPEAVNEKDKFADILTITHFAVTKKHLLKFSSPVTKKIEGMYIAIKSLMSVCALVILAMLALIGSHVLEITKTTEKIESTKGKLQQAEARLAEITEKKNKLPDNYKKLVDIMSISKTLPTDKFRSVRLINNLESIPQDGTFQFIAVNFKHLESDKGKFKYEVEIELELYVAAQDQDVVTKASNEFMEKVKQAFPGKAPNSVYEITYTTEPKGSSQGEFEKIESAVNPDGSLKEAHKIPAKIKIVGTENEI